MPTAGVINGTAVKIAVNGKKVAYCTNTSLSINMDTIDTTTKDASGWASYMGGLNSWEMSGDALYSMASGSEDTIAIDLFDAMLAKTLCTTMIYPTPYSAGDYYWSGSGYITSLELSAGVEDVAAYSFNFQGTGKLSKTATTSSGTSTPSGGGETP